MDDQRFDRLAKSMAGGLTRRRALKLLGGGIAAAAAALAGRPASAAVVQGTCSSDLDCQAPPADCLVAGACNASGQCEYPIKSRHCYIDGQCYAPLQDNPANPCEFCSASNQTAFVRHMNGYSCDDGNACTVNDTCQAGVCRPGNPVVCTASDACHAPGTCDAGTGTCSPETLIVGICKSGRIKDGPCDCDGTCCAAGDNCVGKPGERRCMDK